ncbi:MAG: hypothetical protein IJE70_05325 [Oscillospiraceae bacterium]|nr:hypothetical protein [Oscillospiraceae bacterium]
MSAKKKKSNGLSGRFAVFITILLFVCTVIFLNNQFSSGSLRRISYWIFNGVRGDATDASIVFDSNEYNRFTVLNGNLCIISPELISSKTLSGKTSLSEPVLLRSPAVTKSDLRFVAYDLGGLNFYIANSKKLLHSGTAENKILNAGIGKSGHLALVTEDTDSKALLTVYSPSFEPVYKFHSSGKYVFDASLSPNGKTVAVITYGTSNGIFESSLSLAKLNSDGFYSTASLGGSMPLKVCFRSDNRILVICNDKTVVFDNDGELKAEIPYNELPVKAFSKTSEKYVSIILDNYQNGGNTRLLLIDNNGNNVSLDFDEDVYSLSSKGNYTAVQFSDKCVVFEDDLSVHCEFAIPTSITQCIMNNDGSVLSIGDNFATLYVQ